MFSFIYSLTFYLQQDFSGEKNIYIFDGQIIIMDGARYKCVFLYFWPHSDKEELWISGFEYA